MNGDIVSVNGQSQANVVEFLKDQLNKSALSSKKYKMAMFGLKGIGLFFIVGIAMAFIRPALLVQITGLIQIAMGAWAGVVTVFIGMQGALDYGTTSGITTTATVTTQVPSMQTGNPPSQPQPQPSPTPTPVPTPTPTPTI